jgi:hypothetical protein
LRKCADHAGAPLDLAQDALERYELIGREVDRPAEW